MSAEHERSDAETLGKLGYAQELLRGMGGFSSFAVSFSIISVLTGCITTYGDAIGPGGPASLGLGWPLVTVGTLVVALAMAELASAFPTAGALYHWSAMLGGPSAGWFTATMNLVGQIAIVAAIDLGCAKVLAATLGLPKGAAVHLLLFILASQAAVNVVSVRLVARLNDLSATVHILGVLVIVAGLLTRGLAQPVSFLGHTGETTRADGNATLGFLNALLLSMYTFTGYDASAHLSEETHDPARRAPRGILSAVGVSAVAGYLLLAALTLSIRDLPSVARAEEPALAILTGALGPTAGRAAMGMALVAMWFCGLSSVTSSSRTIYAFARDGGLPAAAWLSRVHATRRTPVPAILAATAGPLVLVHVTRLFGEALFVAMAQMATMGLYLSYAAPILLGAVARHRGRWTRRGPFALGPLGVPIAWGAVAWTAFVLVVCTLPPNNVAGGMLGGMLAGLFVAWAIFVRGRFRGPKVDLAAFELSAEGAGRSADRPGTG